MQYILRRLGFYLIALVTATLIDFIAPRLLPGDPAAVILGQSSNLTPEQISDLRQALGLTNDPLPVQFLSFLSHAVRGDFGDLLFVLPGAGHRRDRHGPGLDAAAGPGRPDHQLCCWAMSWASSAPGGGRASSIR